MMKRIVTGALSAALVLSLTLVPASAHGGGHGRGHGRSQTQQINCTVCQTTHAQGACTAGHSGHSGGHTAGVCYRA